MEIHACPQCGSRNLMKKYLFEGPITYVHETYETCTCKNCGWEGVPICFHSEKQYTKFLQEMHKKEEGSGDS